MRKLLFSLFIGISISMTASSQPICGFDTKMQELKNSNPEYARNFNETEQFIRNFIAAHPENARKPKVTYVIPVVVHVMHTGGPVGSIYNPTDAQIMGAINYLNQVYAGTYPGMEAPVEGGGVVDMELQFALAQRTPSCGYTNGIERIDASGIPNYVSRGVNVSNSDGVPDVTLKDYARWNPAQYYNIWVVNKIDSKDGTSGQFTAGFAYFAGAPGNVDGTVMLATQMKTGAKTLPHEIGHAFNLGHVFEGSSVNTECPPNTDCTVNGDGVCDTDPVSMNANSSGVINFTCRTGINSCTGTNYTKNTESNFMGYTFCYTLFTNGQKARVQAALALPSRSGFLSSPALTPCGPEISFGIPSATTVESSGAQTGCRNYTDYTYQLTIGQAPTAQANVTLSFGGNATKGLDYEVTTNGNFVTPDNVLTFAAGSTVAQQFTVRVYDDASVESTETAILNFSVSTSGNATKSSIYPTFTITITDNDKAPVATSSSTYQVGTIGFTLANPFNSANQKQRGQFLYKASELTAAGLTAGSVNSLQLFVNSKNTTGSFNDVTIRLGKSSLDYLVDGSFTPGSSFTTVYSNPSLSTISGWNTFSFSTPYIWDGISNIVVEYCYVSATGTGSDAIGGYSDGGAAGQANFILKSGIDCGTQFSTVNYYGNGAKPIARFGLDVTGTEVETSAAGSHTEYLGVGSDDYYYSSTNKIIARIQNLDAEPGCVNVTVENAGNTWQSLFTGTRSAKVFEVTPAANGSITGYTISLYFTDAELDGRAPGTLRIAKTSATTMGEVNESNTVIVTPTVAMLGSNAVFTADFTGFSRFFLVDNLVLLPVNLVSFTGRLNDRSEAELQWKVNQQRNLSSFDVERSEDGQSFTTIQNVLALQGTGNTFDYSFIDKKVADGANYYRLKMIDNDGKFAYSRVIKITNHTANRFVTLESNPVKDAITIQVNNSELSPVAAVLYNATGARIAMWQLGSRSGTVRLPIDRYSLASGIYLLQVSNGDKIVTLKVQKK